MNTLTKISSSLAIVIAVTGCASNQEKVQTAVRESVGESTSLSDFKTYQGGVSCGSYETMDYSGNVKKRKYIVLEDEVLKIPSRTDLQIFCSENPKKALNESLAIDFDAQRKSINAVIKDFEFMEKPLLEYERDNGYFPWTEQTLDALVKPATIGNTPRNFPEGGYIKSVPKDPWGNEYQYIWEPFAGVRTMYTITSFGADGQPGGEGENADISTKQLKYFKHVEKIQ